MKRKVGYKRRGWLAKVRGWETGRRVRGGKYQGRESDTN